jgi:hypothetical protein
MPVIQKHLIKDRSALRTWERHTGERRGRERERERNNRDRVPTTPRCGVKINEAPLRRAHPYTPPPLPTHIHTQPHGHTHTCSSGPALRFLCGSRAWTCACAPAARMRVGWTVLTTRACVRTPYPGSSPRAPSGWMRRSAMNALVHARSAQITHTHAHAHTLHAHVRAMPWFRWTCAVRSGSGDQCRHVGMAWTTHGSIGHATCASAPTADRHARRFMALQHAHTTLEHSTLTQQLLMHGSLQSPHAPVGMGERTGMFWAAVFHTPSLRGTGMGPSAPQCDHQHKRM